jgi:hypothetical protein
MRRIFSSAIMLLALAQIASAQDRDKSNSLRRDEPTSPVLTSSQTPEMWFYEQERARWENPQEAVRRKAESRGAQRGQRIAAMKWYGMSNSRPMASLTPMFGTYSPTWTSNSADPLRWRPGRDTAANVIIVR